MATDVFPPLIGKIAKDNGGREIGRIVSFIIDSSGNVKEALIENKSEELVRYSVERLKDDGEEVLVVSDVERRVENLCEELPILVKKREILESLFKNKEILPEIYESLSAEFDKSINDLRVEAQSILSEVESQIQQQENNIKMLHLARTFLEMEHGVGNVKDDVFRQSLISILKEIKYSSYKKMNLLKIKDKVSSIIPQSNLVFEGHTDQKSIMSVRITDK